VVVEVDVEKDGGVAAEIAAGMVTGDVVEEGMAGLGLAVVAGLEEDGGVVNLWKDLVVVIVLEKVKGWWFEWWSFGVVVE